MACSIFKSQVDRDADNRIVNVNAPNGNPSRLYNALKGVPKVMNPYDQVYLDALESDGQIGNWRDSQEEYALGLWSKIHTSRFDREFGANAVLDENNEPVVRGQYYLGKDGQNRPVHGDGSTMPEELATPGAKEASFDKGLAQKIQDKLQALYPEIKLKITNTPVWEQGDNVFNQEEYNNQVNYRLNATKKILDNLNKIKQWESNKSINQETLWKKIGELGVPKQQLDLLKETEGNTVEEKLSNFIATYIYTVEVNTAKDKNVLADMRFEGKLPNTQYHSNLTVPGGINYTENEIATPAITPAIKGHAEFATDQGIGWFRSDEQVIGGEFKTNNNDPLRGWGTVEGETAFAKTEDGTPTKTRRILEVQSDLFQKGRDKKTLTTYNDLNKLLDEGKITEEEYYSIDNTKNSKNQFLQLLNKDNNWVTFFIKSIIQDSAKKGYEKVLFPSGNTASKVEGHTTLEEFIYNFYENTVANILKKQGYAPKQITDEYGNTWNEITINQARDLSEVLLQRNEANQIIGQANIKAMSVLVDAVNQKQDTLPHEYAHHYIAWYRNTPIVQEAIKKWGSEEALVQSIGEQVVKQKGEAYNWWKKFVEWIMNQFNSLSKLQKEELTQILTDAFLTRQDLSFGQSQTGKDATALDNLISKLEQLGIIEKDCRGGGIKAKDGIRSKFTRGSQWELVKDLKGYPSHAQGGVDIQLGKDGFSFTRGESQVLAAHGLVLPKTK